MEEELLNNLPKDHLNHVIDRRAALKELISRCTECKNNYIKKCGIESYLDLVYGGIKMPIIKNISMTLISDDMVVPSKFDELKF